MSSPVIHNTLARMESDTNRMNFERGRASLGSDTLDKNAFLQLLMAKLKMQDPLNPVKDADFMNQQAILTQVEKMDQLTKAMEKSSLVSQGSNLVGKRVDLNDMGFTVNGVIDSVSFGDGSLGISVNGHTYSADQISKIYSQ